MVASCLTESMVQKNPQLKPAQVSHVTLWQGTNNPLGHSKGPVSEHL